MQCNGASGETRAKSIHDCCVAKHAEESFVLFQQQTSPKLWLVENIEKYCSLACKKTSPNQVPEIEATVNNFLIGAWCCNCKFFDDVRKKIKLEWSLSLLWCVRCWGALEGDDLGSTPNRLWNVVCSDECFFPQKFPAHRNDSDLISITHCLRL